MRISAHIQLANSWQNALAKLDPEVDYLAYLEFSMMLGTTLMNAVLHKRGISDESFDQNHTNRPPISEEMSAQITPDVAEMMDLMSYIERARNLHCRAIGEDRGAPRVLPKWDPKVVAQCAAKIEAIQVFAESVIVEQ